MERALLAQFHPLEEALTAMGVAVSPMVELEEADDALASAAHLAAADERVDKVCIWTPDKDLAQCVAMTSRVVQIDRRAGEDPQCTRRRAGGGKFGVEPGADSGFPSPWWGMQRMATRASRASARRQPPACSYRYPRHRGLSAEQARGRGSRAGAVVQDSRDAAQRRRAVRRCRGDQVARPDGFVRSVDGSDESAAAARALRKGCGPNPKKIQFGNQEARKRIKGSALKIDDDSFSPILREAWESRDKNVVKLKGAAGFLELTQR